MRKPKTGQRLKADLDSLIEQYRLLQTEKQSVLGHLDLD